MEKEEIIKKVRTLLSENPEWKERFKGYIESIITNKANTEPKEFHKPQGLSLYCSISRRNAKSYMLRFGGQNVAEIRIKKDGPHLRFKEGNNTKDVKWSSNEAKEFRRKYKNAQEDIKDLRSPEHAVESRLLKEFAKTEAAEKALCNIQPVKLYGCFFQMPTPISASNHNEIKYARAYGGNIDILARVTTRSGEHNICVMEVKDENKSQESQSDAIGQALAYAVFIAELLRSESCISWYSFFMDREKEYTSMPQNLDIDVVTVMPKGNSGEFTGKIFEENLNVTFHCHTLYYDNEAFNNREFVFSGTYPENLKK